jgi:uncharacterized protein YciI
MLSVFLAAMFLFPQASAPAVGSELYYIVLLRPDPARQPLAQADAERIQAAHMANIHAMADRGILVAAGPFEDDTPKISGIFIFKTTSLEEARRVASQDPTVLEHRNTVEAFAWWGPGGIGVQYMRLHKENPQTPEGMGVHPLALLYRGPRWNEKATERLGVMAAEEEFLQRLRHSGKVAAAGPVEGSDVLDSIVIFERMPPSEAQTDLAALPAVRAGFVRAEFHRWWSAEHVLPR